MVWGQSLGSASEFGSEFAATVWSLGQSLESQSEFAATVWSLGLGPESGVWARVWVRVWGKGSKFGATVWSLVGVCGRFCGQSLGSGSSWVRVWRLESGLELCGQSQSLCHSLGPESGLRVRVWGQSLEFGSEFGTRVRV